MFIDFFKKVSDYFANQTKADGSLVCKKHKIEHTGKNAYSIVIDSWLYQETADHRYFERAKERAMRTASQLVQDPDSADFIFYPGRLGKYNMSNSVIDSGACSDVLANFYATFVDKLSAGEKTAIQEVITKNCQSYLAKASLDKEITNQRLWGATGLASAFKAFGQKTWQEIALKSIEKSLVEMWPDGTLPYHPNWQKYGLPEPANDITPYYHSRCLAFVYYILECLNQDIGPFQEKLIKGANLLIAMYQPNGLKNIYLDAKRWYWKSPYEIASNAFDVYALVKTYQLTSQDIYLYYAQKSLEQILKHQLADGGITSHLGKQHNFQCRVFWNGHLAWLVRALEMMPDLASKKIAEPVELMAYFKESGLVKFKNNDFSFILRTKTSKATLMWGSLFGAGTLLYFGQKNNGWQNKAKLKSPTNSLTVSPAEIKKLIYHIWIELRAGQIRVAIFLFFDMLKNLILWS